MPKYLTLAMGLMLIASFSASTVQSQQLKSRSVHKSTLHHEKIEDAYLPHPDQKRFVSKAYMFRDDIVFTTQVNVNADGQNIIGDAANEPSISLDPSNPDKIVIGWRQFDNINSNFRQAGYAFTADFGQTWTFPGSINAGVFRSDPVLDIDSDGTFYYNSLTSNNGEYTCKVFRSTDGGTSWDDGVEAKGGDKQWMVIDKTEGQGKGNIYSFWTSYWSSCYPGNYTRSINGGNSYENCSFVDGDPYWGTMAVGPDGSLYIAGSGWQGIVVSKSTNAQNPIAATLWDFTSQLNMEGDLSYGAEVNPGGLLGQASIAVDHSGTVSHGNVYVLASVQRYSNDPGDVMFSRSIDGGISWSSPVRVNQDLSFSNTQWFGTMSVAPNGRIDAVWLDTRDASSLMPRKSALYYSYSVDNGQTWSLNRRISELFDPHVGWPNQEKMGDYFHMISDDESAHLAWANTLNGGQDVFYTRITLDITGIEKNNDPSLLLSVYPNPVSDIAHLTYQIGLTEKIEISITDTFGKLLWIEQSSSVEAGKHFKDIQFGHFTSGIYYLTIKSNHTSETLKIMKQ
ncbi:MAG: hypothetical protein CVT92_14525 [Bacteroidetes bacterium HGW-Bacteroidetes-1]|jgi:hypothetical protein|nr:MAG: hypothetical protein CVT92_14525 [Bacteroidetes bacterium HGW-Bacteroidetes-1]